VVGLELPPAFSQIKVNQGWPGVDYQNGKDLSVNLARRGTWADRTGCDCCGRGRPHSVMKVNSGKSRLIKVDQGWSLERWSGANKVFYLGCLVATMRRNLTSNMGIKATAGKRPAWSKWAIRVGVVLFIYTLAGFFLVPWIIKSQMLKRLPAMTKRQVAVQQVKFNPYALSLTIRGFSLAEPDGEVFSSFDELYVNFQTSSLFKWKLVFSEISLKKPFAQVTYREDGNFNFANLISNPSPQPKGPPQAPPPLLVYQLSITNGAVGFADLKRKTPFRTRFVPIQVNLTNLTTIRDKNSPYSFIARTGEGEVFAWSGSVSINPLRSAGSFRLGGLKLGKYATYAQDYARFQIADGMIDVGADYSYDSVAGPLALELTNAAVHLSNIELKAVETGETVLKIPSLSVQHAEASVIRRTARVGEVKSTGGFVLARQEHDGTINLLSQLILPAKENLPAGKPSEEPAAPWTAKIDEIVFDNYSIKAEDKKPTKAASFSIDQLGFTLRGVSNLSNAPVTAALSLRFQETGMIALEGKATLLPPSADLQVTITNLDLRPVQPYVEEQVKLVISSGALALHGHARYAAPEPGAPLINFTGGLALNKFTTTDDVLFKDFAKWDALTVEGIQLDLQPDKLQIDQVKFTGLDTSVVIGPDKRPNLQTILRKETGGAEATPQQSPAADKKKLPSIALGALVLENASIHFSDQSLEPHCSFAVQEFGGTIQGLSSQAGTTATVDVKGKVDDRSPFSATGKVNPLRDDLFADISVTFTNTELTSFTPYTEKFAGRPLQKGKLSFAVHYLVNKNELKAENGFYVDQLTLGPKNNSPDATSLPVKLAIALLKDRNGRIQLDVPVQGRMDDPKFELGPVIWHVVGNLIVKAATSPFALLGAAFGGGDELSFVDFQPGRLALRESETKKLDTLAKALYERPSLNLEINGSADPSKDREALARVRFEEQIKALWIKEQNDSNPTNATLEQVKVEPKAYERLVRKTYRKTLGSYRPTESASEVKSVATTNAPSATATNTEVKLVKSAPARQKVWGPGREVAEHGSLLLFSPAKLVKTPAKTAAVIAATNGQPAPKELTPRQEELADMEDQLVKKFQISDDDLRDLMQGRANKVQAYLLQTEKVTAERLFIIAPKAIDGSFKGEIRANLSLN
jgi:uncharacterized protein involved in outer membrane biogenesis